MKKKLIGIIICMLLVGTVIPISGQIINGNVIKDSNGNNPYLNGNTWIKTFDLYDYDIGYTVQQTTDGGYIIIGETKTLFGRDALLIKTDSAGEELWIKNYDERLGDETANSGQQTIDGGFILIGHRFDGQDTDVLLVKTDSNGNVPRYRDISRNHLSLNSNWLKFLDMFPILQRIMNYIF